MTPITIEAEAVPLEWQEDGRVLRVRGTRVPLETIVRAYRAGLTAEQIADEFDTLLLADVYSVLGYMLRHRADVERYMKWVEDQTTAMRAEVEPYTVDYEFEQRLRTRLAKRHEAS
jgi:uncharacterized protein (DUF433 family)